MFFSQLKPSGHQRTWLEGVFAQLFTKLSVNTIGRSDNIDDLKLTDIDWENDAFTIAFSNTKSDVAGETTSDKKRLYANPFLPETCVHLGLAVYTWVKAWTNTRYLFDGQGQNNRYYRQLLVAMKSIPEHIDIGCKREDIGTHSNRKFAESTSVSKIDGPDRTQVCLRAGQSVGRTQDCYMFAEDDGDSLVGRTVAQLKYTADEFDVLPPHFSNETLETLNNYGWNRILPSFPTFPPSFQRVIPRLFATLVYHHHKGHLLRILDPGHPLFSSPVFTTHNDLIASLRNKVLIGHGYCPYTHMSAQGVPGFIIVSREVRDLKAMFQQQCKLDEERFANVSQKIEELVRTLPQHVVDVLMEKVRIDGAQPVTLDSIRGLVLELLQTPMDQLSSQIQALSLMTTNHGNTRNGELLTGNEDPLNTHERRSGATVFLWPGSDTMHRVPCGFIFPKSLSTKLVWNLWFFGDRSQSIGAYRFIKPSNDLVQKDSKVRYSRAKAVIAKLVDIAVVGQKIQSMRDIEEGNTETVFSFAFNNIVPQLYQEPKRPEDLVLDSMYERLRMKNLLLP